MTDYNLLLPPPTISQANMWAVVTAVSPLRVQLPGDPGPLPFTPDTLVAGLAVGDRVWVQLTTNNDPATRSRRVVVVGKGGGVVWPASVFDTQNAGGTTASNGYTATLTGAGAVACGVTFVAPYSGRVMVHNTVRASVATSDIGHITFRVTTGGTPGAGTVAFEVTDGTAIIVQNTNDQRATVSTLVSGLTPGATYSAQQQFRVAPGTGPLSVWDKSLSVVPVP